MIGIHCGKISRTGVARNVYNSGRINSKGSAIIIAGTAQIGRVKERGSAGAEPGDEGVLSAGVSRLVGAYCGEIG